VLGYGDQNFLSCMGISMYTGFSVSANQTERVEQETYVSHFELEFTQISRSMFFLVVI